MAAKNSSSKTDQESIVSTVQPSSSGGAVRGSPEEVASPQATPMADQKQLILWCSQPPLWVLDSWTYDVVVRTGHEGRDWKGSGRRADDKLRVRQTAYGTTSMLLQREGAALAALCVPEEHSSEEGEDHRDVALVVAMAKMIAFLPFAGVRAATEAPTELWITQSRALHSDHAWHSRRGGKFKTTFMEVAETTVELIETVTVAKPGAGDDRTIRVPTGCVACGAVGSIAFLHEISKRGIDADVPHYIDMYFRGACLSDNVTSIDLLLRFPPPEWVEGIANFFHLSQGATQPQMTREGSSSLVWLYWKLWRHLPSKNFWANGTPIYTEHEFQKKILEFKDSFPTDPSRQPPILETNPSALHARLVSNIINKKQYPNCGRGGYMDFPKKDIADIISLLSSRIPRDTLMSVDGKNLSPVDLAIMCVELQPEYPGGWLNLTYAMGRTETVQISDLFGSTRKTKVEVATHGLELYLAAQAKDPAVDDSSAWNNLAYYMSVDDPDSLVTVNGKTYSCIECSHRGLQRCLATQGFSSTGSKWDTVAGILKPVRVRMNDPDLEVESPEEVVKISPTTHFTDERTGKHFTNMECQLVALGLNPKRHVMWAHVGLILWKNAKALGKEDTDSPMTVGIPQRIINEVDSLIFDQALQGKTLSEMKRELQCEVVGAGGKEDPMMGETDHIVFFTELECYLVGYFLDDLGLLRELVREPPEDLERFITVVTPDRISEKGRRIVESHMDGGGTFEKTYS